MNEGNAESSHESSNSLSSEGSTALSKESQGIQRWLDQSPQEEPWSPVSRTGDEPSIPVEVEGVRATEARIGDPRDRGIDIEARSRL